MSKLGKFSFFVCGISVIVLFVARFIIGGWLDYLYAPLVISLLAFILAIAVDAKFYLEFLTMRTTKHGMNMGALILMALLMTVAVNFLGSRYDKTFDLTKEKINSLSDQSVEVVKNLKDEVKVLIFYKGKQFKERAREIRADFKLYEANSSKIKVNVVDSNYDVELAKKYLENSEVFAAVIEYKGQRSLIKNSAGTPERPVYQEADITSALVKITRERVLNIFFLTGHGEKDIDATSLEGLKLFTEALRSDGYTVSKLNLLTGDKLPEPPAVLAIVGPKTALTDKELTEVRDFVKKGGGLFLAIDPGEKHNLALLTKPFGVEFKNNYVVNEVQGTDEGFVGAVGVDFDQNSDVTKKLAQNRSLAVFPFASELGRASDSPGDFVVTEIIKSHPRAYHVNSPNAVEKNPDRRQHTLAITTQSDKSRIAIFGDSDFLSDVRINRFVHMDLALNTMAYLLDDPANITIRPKSLESTKLEITQNKGLAITIAGISLPLGLIVLAGVFWYRRRNL